MATQRAGRALLQIPEYSFDQHPRTILHPLNHAEQSLQQTSRRTVYQVCIVNRVRSSRSTQRNTPVVKSQPFDEILEAGVVSIDMYP